MDFPSPNMNPYALTSMAEGSSTRPRLTPEEALTVVRERFALPVDRAEPLPSDRDQNFLISELSSDRKYVLKLAHAGEHREVLDFQNRILEHLARANFPLSKVLFDRDGKEILEVPGPDGQVFLTRLLSWIPGQVLAEVKPQTPGLFRSLGVFLGGMDRALEDFSHPAQDRELHWNLKAAGKVVRSHLQLVADPSRRDLLEEMLARSVEALGPLVPDLRMSVIQSDANDHNVLVNELGPHGDPEDRRVTGLLDFGDAVRSFTAGEPAIGAAYAMLGKADPLTVAAHVVEGYHSAFPLREEEVAALFPLLGLRLCASVAIAAFQKSREPENQYLTVSEAPAWSLLARLAQENTVLPHVLFRQACGFEAVAGAQAVVDWLEEHGAEASPVVGQPGMKDRLGEGWQVERGYENLWPTDETESEGVLDLSRTPLHVLDFSITSGEFTSPPEAGDAEGWTERIFRKLKEVGAEVGVGRYDEVRRWYTSDIFREPGDGAPEWRTVHIGVDLFVQPGAQVFTPFNARIHSVGHNRGLLDYGPTVILEHETDTVTFWTLYGHLDDSVLGNLIPGGTIQKGQPFARVGTLPGNGNWAPHLHFQIITDTLGKRGDFPGVCRPSQRDLWKLLSPDPNLILRMPDPGDREGPGSREILNSERPGPATEGVPSGVPLTPPWGHEKEELLELRKALLGPNLSISYKRPLKIVRGQGQYLYDQEGQAYLDCVNNVPNVGHNHPRVVEAGRRQMGILNTNTRYLHDLILEYAQELVELLPGNLSRVYFVNSGSEANELALRMARAHTRRKDVVVVEGAYHGHTSSLVDISPYKFDGPGGAGPRSWVHTVTMPDPYRGMFRALPEDEFVEGLAFAAAPTSRETTEEPAPGEPRYIPADEVGAAYVRQVQKTLNLMRAGGRHPAVFFCESMLGCGGQIVLPEGYMEGAFQLVREGGGVCVADEVQVGFGRAGSHFWAFQTQDVVPDIVTLGKPMGNGHPLAAVVTTPEIASSFDTGMEYFNTYGGNPVSCAIGLAVLDVILEEGLQENALDVGEYLRTGLRRIQKNHPLMGDVRGLGLYIGVEMVEDPETRAPATEKANRVKERLRDHHLLLSTDGPQENVLKIKPPLVFTRENADRLVETLDRVLAEDEFQV